MRLRDLLISTLAFFYVPVLGYRTCSSLTLLLRIEISASARSEKSPDDSAETEPPLNTPFNAGQKNTSMTSPLKCGQTCPLSRGGVGVSVSVGGTGESALVDTRF